MNKGSDGFEPWKKQGSTISWPCPFNVTLLVQICAITVWRRRNLLLFLFINVCLAMLRQNLSLYSIFSQLPSALPKYVWIIGASAAVCAKYLLWKSLELCSIQFMSHLFYCNTLYTVRRSSGIQFLVNSFKMLRKFALWNKIFELNKFKILMTYFYPYLESFEVKRRYF